MHQFEKDTKRDRDSKRRKKLKTKLGRKRKKSCVVVCVVGGCHASTKSRNLVIGDLVLGSWFPCSLMPLSFEVGESN
jgi:hypothetical protein